MTEIRVEITWLMTKLFALSVALVAKSISFKIIVIRRRSVRRHVSL